MRPHGLAWSSTLAASKPWRGYTDLIEVIARLAAVREQTGQLATSPVFVWLAALFLAADALLIILYILRIVLRRSAIQAGLLSNEMFSIAVDGGYGEIFGYLKAIVITFCFLGCYLRDRAPVSLALGFAFVVIVLDDSLQIHESFGTRLMVALALEPMAGLRAQDLGELIVWSALGAVVAAALAIGFLRSDVQGQNIALIFLGLLAVLILFAVGVDMLHIAAGDMFPGAGLVWTLLEDGGEMVTLSVITAAAVAVVWRGAAGLAWPGPSSRRPLP